MEVGVRGGDGGDGRFCGDGSCPVLGVGDDGCAGNAEIPVSDAGLDVSLRHHFL